MLVPGLGMSSRYLLPTARELAPHLPVWAVELPGFGRTPGPRRALRIDELAGAVEAWIDAEELERPILVGNSLGSQVVLECLVRRPEAYAGAVLTGLTIDPAARSARTQLLRLLRTAPSEPFWIVLLVVRSHLRHGPLRVRATARYALHDPVVAKLPRVEVPTVVVRGERDALVPARWAKEAARLLPDGRLVELPRAAHALTATHPAEIARIVRDLAERVTPPAGKPA